MSLAIGHREDDIVVLDALREIKPPFSPESVRANSICSTTRAS